MPELVVLGDCPVELWCRGPFTPDILFRSRVGGGAFQLAQAAAGHGFATGIVTRLGDDLFEPYIRAEMQRAGLDASRCITVPGPNGVVFSSGDRANLKRTPRRAGSAAAGLTLLDEDVAFIEGGRWFCCTADFQCLSAAAQDSVYAAFKTAFEAGVRTAFVAGFDPRQRGPEAERLAIVEIAPLLEVAFVDLRYAADWLDADDPERIAAWILEQGIRTAVVRGGGIVSAVGTAGKVRTVPAGHASMPAGGRDDAAIDASFLAALAKGDDPVSAAWGGNRAPQPPAPPQPAPSKTSQPAPAHAVVYIDGGSRGNPGVAGAGVYFEVDGQPWRGLYEYLGHQTNNFAEYSALLHALQYSLAHGVRRLSVCSDSELLVKQLKGIYRVKNPALQRLHAEAGELIHRLERFSIRHVPREQNKEADALANRAQDEKASGEESYA